MKKFLTPVMLLLLSFAPKIDDLQYVSLMEKVTIGLPGVANEDNSKGIPMQKVVMDDGTEFNAFAMDYSKFGMSEDMLQAMAGTDEFKTQMESMMTMQQGVKLLKNETGKYNDKYTCYDITLDVDKDGYKGTMYQKMVFYKQYGITLIYMPGKKGMNAELRDHVFNSLKIEP